MGSICSKNSPPLQSIDSTYLTTVSKNSVPIEELIVLEKIFTDLSLRNFSSENLEKTSLLSFIKLPGLLGERLCNLYFLSSDEILTFSEFCLFLKNFCTHDFSLFSASCFEVFDHRNDGVIDKDELRVSVLPIQLFYLLQSAPRPSSALSLKTELLPLTAQTLLDNVEEFHQMTPRIFSINQSKKFPGSLHEELSDRIMSEFGNENGVLTADGFTKMLGKFENITSGLKACFREDMWRANELPRVRMVKRRGCGVISSKHISVDSSSSHSGNFYLINDVGIIKHFGIIKGLALFIFEFDHFFTLKELIYLKECLIRQKTIYSMNSIIIYHSTQYDQRIALGFNSEAKLKVWLKHLKSAANYKRFLDYYTLGSRISSGKFAEVNIAYSKTNSKKFAVKIITKRRLDRTERKMLQNEIRILKTLKHPGAAKFVECFYSKKHVHIVMEYVEGTQLLTGLNKFCGNETIIKKILAQLCKVLEYLNSIAVMHRDLKLENIIIKENEEIVVIDFGLSVYSYNSDIQRMSCGSLIYVAPEVLLKQGYNSLIDLWSLGVIAFILLTGKPPFIEYDNKTIAEKIMNEDLEFDEDLWKAHTEESKDFCRELLNKNPNLRLNAKQALEHQFIKNSLN